MKYTPARVKPVQDKFPGAGARSRTLPSRTAAARNHTKGPRSAPAETTTLPRRVIKAAPRVQTSRARKKTNPKKTNNQPPAPESKVPRPFQEVLSFPAWFTCTSGLRPGAFRCIQEPPAARDLHMPLRFKILLKGPSVQDLVGSHSERNVSQTNADVSHCFLTSVFLRLWDVERPRRARFGSV